MKTIFNNSKSLEIKGKVRGTAPLIQQCHFCGEPIIKIFGQDPDSLVNHHITYIPEVKAPAHRDCHAKYHAEEAKRKMRVAKSGPENNRKVRKKRCEPYDPTEMKHGRVVKNKKIKYPYRR